MINLKNPGKTTDSLQKFLLFCLFTQRMNAEDASQRLDKFLSWSCEGSRLAFRIPMTPFQKVRYLIRTCNLTRALLECELGPLGRFEQALPYVCELAVYTATLRDLERIPGIGPKTSRMFLMFGRGEKHDHVILDQHILDWLARRGYRVPAKVSGEQYTRLETAFVREANSMGILPGKLDEAILLSMA